MKNICSIGLEIWRLYQYDQCSL